uniref:IRS-type PTB domain-containing protein n=1 Tax=Macrostomum lignano TaxID=282301 RepID=A0A1I8F8U3_9PLAT
RQKLSKLQTILAQAKVLCAATPQVAICCSDEAKSQTTNLFLAASDGAAYKLDVRLAKCSSGTALVTFVLVTVEGQALTFGRNQLGQLGVGRQGHPVSSSSTQFEALRNIRRSLGLPAAGHKAGPTRWNPAQRLSCHFYVKRKAAVAGLASRDSGELRSEPLRVPGFRGSPMDLGFRVATAVLAIILRAMSCGQGYNTRQCVDRVKLRGGAYTIATNGSGEFLCAHQKAPARLILYPKALMDLKRLVGSPTVGRQSQLRCAGRHQLHHLGPVAYIWRTGPRRHGEVISQANGLQSTRTSSRCEVAMGYAQCVFLVPLKSDGSDAEEKLGKYPVCRDK